MITYSEVQKTAQPKTVIVQNAFVSTDKYIFKNSSFDISGDELVVYHGADDKNTRPYTPYTREVVAMFPMAMFYAYNEDAVNK